MANALSLKIFHNGQFVDQKTLEQGVIKIGKLRSSHLCLDDESIARMHAVIESSGSDVRVIDLGGHTGTLVNGQRIDKNASLADGDALDFGPYRVEVEMLYSAGISAAGFGAVMPVAPAAAVPTHAHRSSAAPAITPQVTPQPVIDPAPSRAPLTPDASEVEKPDTRVTEVVASYRGTVLDAQHVGQVRGRRNSAPMFLGAAAALMLCGAGMLAVEVTQDWEGYAAAKATAIETGAEMPEVPGYGLGGLGMGLMLLGLIPMGLGMTRLQDRGMNAYRIGESSDAQLTVAGQDSFPLVKEAAGGHVLNFTQAMEGEVSVGGQSITLAELATSGRAANAGGAFSYALPSGARCKVRHGDLTFHVNEVAAGKRLAGKQEADKPFWAYNAASLAAIGSLLIMTHLIPDDAMAMAVEDDGQTNRYVGYMNQPDIAEEEEEIIEEPSPENEKAGGTGTRHKGDEGQMGDPKKKAVNKMYAMKGPKTALPQMARNFDPDMQSRNAGILGELQKESGHFLASPYGAPFAVGNDDDDLWGNMTGTEQGESGGFGGLGMIGTGRGGGGLGEGTVGMGNIGLIGHGGGNGTGTGYGPGSGNGKATGFDGRAKRLPRVRGAKITKISGMDKDIIRRIVRNHFREVTHCYNQGLVRDPNLEGRVAIQFSIGPTGKVMLAAVTENTSGDQNVGNCIAKAVKRWTFPKPTTGGTAMVNYPFVLRHG